jgi:hypothetical protein
VGNREKFPDVSGHIRDPAILGRMKFL